MQGMSERQYAAHVGLSRGAVQKAKLAERLVLYPDGSINAAASDARRADTTDPSKTRKPPEPKLKPVPEAAVASVGETLREEGLPAPVAAGGTTFLQAKTANEVLKAQERRIRLQKLKGELIERARAGAGVPPGPRGPGCVGELARAVSGADGGRSRRGARRDAEGSGNTCTRPPRRACRGPARLPVMMKACRISTARQKSSASGARG